MKLFGQNCHDSGKIKSNNAKDVLDKLHVVKNVQMQGKDIYYFHSQFPVNKIIAKASKRTKINSFIFMVAEKNRFRTRSSRQCRSSIWIYRVCEVSKELVLKL